MSDDGDGQSGPERGSPGMKKQQEVDQLSSTASSVAGQSQET